MSTIVGANVLTYLEMTRRLDPKGKIAVIGETMNQYTEILDDMRWQEGNLLVGHKSTVRTGIPQATWRKLYQGISPTRSSTAPILDQCGMLEAYSEVDKAEADLNGNSNDFRWTEDLAHLEGMSQQLGQALFYGDSSVDKEKIMGLTPRYNDFSAKSGANIIDGGGRDNDNMSIWLVLWGPLTTFGIFPQGSKAGFSLRDLGEVTKILPDGSQYQALRTHYKWDSGLVVKDWRFVVRIANIKTGNLSKAGNTGADLVDLMTQAIELPYNLTLGTPVFYTNRTGRSFLRRQIANKDNVHLMLDQVAGKHVLTFDGIPVRRVDQLVNTESPVIP